MPLNVVAIVQARMGSTRLPGKVLADVAGRSMLARVCHRASRATRVDRLVVATTDDASDHPVVVECDRLGVPWFRGSVADVLDRYDRAARAFAADVVVRVTADCPLIDPGVIDRVVDAFLGQGPSQESLSRADQSDSSRVHETSRNETLQRVPCPRLPWTCGDDPASSTCPRQAWAWHPTFPQQEHNPTTSTAGLPDYASNTLRRSWPRGLDVEVFSAAALARASREATLPFERAHVTPYIYGHPDRFRLLAVTGPGSPLNKSDSWPSGATAGLSSSVFPENSQCTAGQASSGTLSQRAARDLGTLRWTVDLPEDLAFVRAVYERLGDDGMGSGEPFGWEEVLRLLEREPGLAELNRHVRQKPIEEG